MSYLTEKIMSFGKTIIFIIFGILIVIVGSFLKSKLKNILMSSADFQAIAPILILGVILLVIVVITQAQIEKNKRIRKITNLINTDRKSRIRINKKVSEIFAHLDQIRCYKRRIYGIGDFIPFIQFHRYLEPTQELINDINQLEQSLIDYMTKHPDEKVVDEVLNKVIGIKKNIISRLDKAT